MAATVEDHETDLTRFSNSFAFVENISVDGVRIKVPEYIPLERNLCLHIRLSKEQLLEIPLKPIWIHEIPPDGLYEMGACFVEISHETKRLIRNFQFETVVLVHG